MRNIAPWLFAFVFAAFAPISAQAQELAVVTDDDATENATDMADLSVVERWQADPTTFFDGSEINLAELEFIARPLIVFADSPNQPAYLEQIRLIEADIQAMVIRDVILILDTDTTNRSDLRTQLRPRGFSLVLIDKMGRVNMRKAEPWDMREVSRQIDKLPLRIQEIRERLGSQ